MTVPSIEWRYSPDPVPYEEALSFMEERVSGIIDGSMRECIWLLEHPPLYTAGTSARSDDLLDPRFPVYKAGRGGEYTYHGPGQRIVYVMLDLARRGKDIRAFVQALENWVIATLKAEYDIDATIRQGRVGVWVPRGDGHDDKIAAIGIRIRRWVSFHGLSLNADPDLNHYAGIVPCGIREHGVTSLAALGRDADMTRLDRALQQHCPFTLDQPLRPRKTLTRSASA